MRKRRRRSREQRVKIENREVSKEQRGKGGEVNDKVSSSLPPPSHSSPDPSQLSLYHLQLLTASTEPSPSLPICSQPGRPPSACLSIFSGIWMALSAQATKGDLATTPQSGHSLPLSLRFAPGHASPHKLPTLQLCCGPASARVADALSNQAASYWLDSAHDSGGARLVEQNRYPRITIDTTSSPSSAYSLPGGFTAARIYTAYWLLLLVP